MIYVGFVIRYFDSENKPHWTEVFKVLQDVLDEQKRLIEAGMHEVIYYRLIEDLSQIY